MAVQKPLRVSAKDAAAGMRQVADIGQAVFVGQALHAIVKFGVPDILGAESMTAASIAAKMPGTPNVDILFRSLHLLASATELFEQTASASGTISFGLSATGAVLQSSNREFQGWEQPSQAASIHFWLRPSCWRALEQLPAFIAGDVADPFAAANGRSYLEEWSADPVAAACNQDFLSCLSVLENPVVAELFDWRCLEGKTVLEISDGGVSTVPLLKREFPGIAAAELELSRTNGDPWATMEIPRTGGAILLKHGLSCRSHERCVEVLRACHAALIDGSKLIVMGCVMPGTKSIKARLAFTDVYSAYMGGGRERNREQWRALGAQAGFHLESVLATPLPFCQILTFSKA